MILKMLFQQDRVVSFLPLLQIFHEVSQEWGENSVGCIHFVYQGYAALYVENAALYLEVNGMRWLMDGKVSLSYAHDIEAGTTRFSVGVEPRDRALVYPAWWKDQGPLIALAVPESSEREDFFAYICRVAADEELRSALTDNWSKERCLDR
ncbi:hypothetical protein L2Y96_03155 [Luteibacter aegosomaticola]|uniref:hypothetical protein n=1 Tax=Luteibacter aegosomaticola TaxID=2911538 RepID=UPI001FFBD782|nr:hypothetical protein [Luteibacter aegosomaticola]UPG90789.1 hypothetical protein L2Y96_03155 [Luteibacter aegosomaticola]